MFELDKLVSLWLFNIQNTLKIGFLVKILGSYSIWLLIFLFLFLLFKENTRKKIYLFGFFLLSILISRGIITEIIRYFYNRQRPFMALGITPLQLGVESWSFPSGHAVTMFSIAFVIMLFGNKKWAWFAFVLAFLSALSRVMMGIHWASDIIAGALLAGVIFAVFYFWVLPPKLAKKE